MNQTLEYFKNKYSFAPKAETYGALANGQKIDRENMPLIDTPKPPMVEIKDNKGEILRKDVDNGQFLNFLRNIAASSVNPYSDVETKVYQGTAFYKRCSELYTALVNGPDYPNNEQGTEFVRGIQWLQEGKMSPVTFVVGSKEYNETIQYLTTILENSIDPRSQHTTSPYEDDADRYHDLFCATRER